MYSRLTFKQGREPAGSSKGGQFAPGSPGDGGPEGSITQSVKDSVGKPRRKSEPKPTNNPNVTEVSSGWLSKGSTYTKGDMTVKGVGGGKFEVSEKGEHLYTVGSIGEAVTAADMRSGARESGKAEVTPPPKYRPVDSGGGKATKPAARTMQDGTVQIDHTEYPKYLESLDEDALRYTIKDAQAAMAAMPEGVKAGYYADEVNYAAMEIQKRRKPAVERGEDLGPGHGVTDGRTASETDTEAMEAAYYANAHRVEEEKKAGR